MTKFEYLIMVFVGLVFGFLYAIGKYFFFPHDYNLVSFSFLNNWLIFTFGWIVGTILFEKFIKKRT